MPDWTYQTVFRPLLMRLPAEMSRRVALGGIGLLGRLPFGRPIIRFFGHMKPDERLHVEYAGIGFASSVGLGYALDRHLQATEALAEFGFGFLEIGPVSLGQGNHLSPSPVSIGEVRDRLRRCRRMPIPLFVRIELGEERGSEMESVTEELRAIADGMVIPLRQWPRLCEHKLVEVTFPFPIFLALTSSDWSDIEHQNECVQAVQSGSIAGVLLEIVSQGDHSPHGGDSPATDSQHGPQWVHDVRSALGKEAVVIASTGICSVSDAIANIRAGANLIQIDDGLEMAGPGLPKRINEAMLYWQHAREAVVRPRESQNESSAGRPTNESWFWALLMGLSMIFGGILALIIAVTRVVLPYDEALTGLTRQQIAQINSRLLSFMTHDRVTLAGTMIAVGIQYTALSWFGMRRGLHWCGVAVTVSALAGFISFFWFLGFGYFDPFHAFVAAILFQFLLMAMHAELPRRQPREMPGLSNDWRWRAGQWGQLIFVAHGAILIVAGTIISSIGMTSVFVPEDLEYMQTTAEALSSAQPRLVALVAHDRASFGGMLLACGLATLLPGLWGFQRGQAWLWWGLMIAGSVAYGATIAVHMHVGYHSWKHLLPAYGGFLMLWIGGIASYFYLAAHDSRLEDEWRRLLTENRLAMETATRTL